MGVPTDGKVQEIIEGPPGPVACEATAADKPPENLSYFHVDQLRCLQRFPGIEKPVGES